MNDTNFLGRGWGFPPRFTKTASGIELRMVEREEDIQESLNILFSTQCGERLMNTQYGCDLHTLQFEGISESIKGRIIDMLEQAILFYEPRIDLLNIDITLDPEQANQGRLSIHLDYIIRSTNSRSNMVYPFYSLEGSNL